MNLLSSRKSNGIVSSTANRLTTLLFIIYLVALFWILLFKLGVRFSYMQNRSVNLVPFRELLISNGRADVSEIILNVMIFIPLGIYVGVLAKRMTFNTKLFSFFLVSLMFEALQFILKVGACDITDIITNTTGGIIGLMIYVAFEKIYNDSSKAQKYLNLIATIGTIIVIALLVLLKLNMLPIRYQ